MEMKLYLDVIFLLNIWFDFLLLLSVSMLLKRYTKIKRIFLGALTGGITFFFLFLNLSSFSLFFFKVIVSILMILVTFSYKNFKYTLTNLGYFYLTSIILGGGMYLLSDIFSYNNHGLLFYKNGFQTNYIVLLIVSPIILFFYIKKNLKVQENYQHYHKVEFLYKGKLYHLTGYLDTGNHLKDPYKKRGIILVNTKLKYNLEEIIYTPYNALNYDGILKCLKVDKLYVDKKEFKNYLIGISNLKFQIDGIDCILHSSMKGII